MIIISLKKMCPRCNTNVIDYSAKYCDECGKNVAKEKADRNREYDKNVRKNVNVYSSKQWHVVRQQALARDKGLCMYCYNKYNKISYASMVHHIRTVNDSIELAYNVNNLVSLCRCCHDDIHKFYDTNDKVKQETEMELYKMIKE